MGQMHLIAVQINNEYKIAQYGEDDGYPEGQGKAVLKFLREENLDLFKDKVLLASWITEDERISNWCPLGVDIIACNGWISNVEAEEHRKLYPELSKKCGSDILGLVYASKGIKLRNNIEFAHDGLWCDWAYIIDFDKNTFEVYAGGCRNPLKEGERFYEGDEEFFIKEYGGMNLTCKYYGVRCLKVFDLSNLPSEEEFIRTFEDND